MNPILHFHPLSSFCHKVLIALYENGTPFEPRIVDFGDPESNGKFRALWPLAKIPVLADGDEVIPETSIIVEYLQQHYPGPVRLLPEDADLCLQARLWDRIFDLHVSVPMQKIVQQRIRPEGQRDPAGAAEAEAMLRTAYAVIERQLAGRQWAVGAPFTLADCAAAPALFYASMLVPFEAGQRELAGYFERLVQRPAVARVLKEAQPYLALFPFRERVPARFLAS
ncbi:MAG: glutathione S-transferase family protein [Reyranellaceae bacterium]